MAFYHDGNVIENEGTPTGTLKEGQKKYFAQRAASRAMGIAERRGYGLGEVGYYINEDLAEKIESDIITPGEASSIAGMAEDMMYQAEDLGATIDVPYNSYYEEERRVEK